MESVASFDDMLDNFILEDTAAGWNGTLFPEAPKNLPKAPDAPDLTLSVETIGMSKDQ